MVASAAGPSPSSSFSVLAILQGFLNGEAEPYQWGILAGCIVYVATILVVLYLLVAGGSFKRMREQADAYQQQGAKAFQVPLTAKPRLYDALLEASRTLPRKPRVEGGRLKGKGVELQVLDATDENVTQALFDISDGSPRYGQGSYDPVERIWRWLPDELGPFQDATTMATALRNLPEDDSLLFYVRDRPSTYVIGMVRIVNNAPQHLRAEIGELWLTPAFRGTYAGVECGLLLLRYLFETLGYRRVEWRCDADNYGAKKSAERMGFTLEGVLHKHMVWREANRDTALYAMTNADWREGAADHLEALVKRKCQDVVGLDKVGEEEEEEQEVHSKTQPAAAGGGGGGGEVNAADLGHSSDSKKDK